MNLSGYLHDDQCAHMRCMHMQFFSCNRCVHMQLFQMINRFSPIPHINFMLALTLHCISRQIAYPDGTV